MSRMSSVIDNGSRILFLYRVNVYRYFLVILLRTGAGCTGRCFLAARSRPLHRWPVRCQLCTRWSASAYSAPWPDQAPVVPQASQKGARGAGGVNVPRSQQGVRPGEAAVDHEMSFTLLAILAFRRRGVACNMLISWLYFDRFEAGRYRQQRRHCDGQQ
jgi:hypothetical protein